MRAPRTTPDVAHGTGPDVEPAPSSSPPDALEAIAEATRATAAGEATAAHQVVEIPVGGLALGRLEGDGDAWSVRIGTRTAPAQLDPSLHPSVAATARARGEAVLVTKAEDGALVVVGALRTSPTPGVDAMDEIALSAKRVRIEATEDAEIRSGIAVIALRAVGEVETYADRIVSRAEEVQKIVARMLRLN